MNKQIRADLMLVFVTLCWGLSYAFMKLCLEEIGPLALITFRFLIGFIVLAILSYKRIKNLNWVTMKYSFIIGAILLLVYFGCTFGVQYTSLTNAGFLCAMTVVFAPILSFIFFKKKPEKKFYLVLILSVLGIGLMTLKSNLSFAVGDIYCLGTALAYAVDLLIMEKAVSTKGVDAYQIGVFQLLFTGLFSLGFNLFFEPIVLPRSPKVWGALLFLAILCTGVAFLIQAIAQQYTSASHVGVIFTLEPVFAALVAYIFFYEVMDLKAYIGGIVLVMSILLMEIEIPSYKDKIKSKNF